MTYKTKTQTVSTSMTKSSTPKVVSISNPPDPEVPEKKPRRRFTAAFKLRILREVSP